MDAKENTNEPRMDADRDPLVERCLACEADSGRHHKAIAFRQLPVKVAVSKTYYYKHPFLY
jgi:hypothetical protein